MRSGSYILRLGSPGSTHDVATRLSPQPLRKRHSNTTSLTSTSTATSDEAGENAPSKEQLILETRGVTTTSHRIRKSSSRSSSPATDGMQPCAEGRAHPFNRIKLERLCAFCEYERSERLKALEIPRDEVKFDPARWRWKYQGKSDTASLQDKGKRRSGLWAMGSAVEAWWT
ncbi:hypothetical protein J1614_002560 [Plenodomus biglobosus]|nr:hypothetical protein J1614_002560 [Plenodomus biglobosus]